MPNKNTRPLSASSVRSGPDDGDSQAISQVLRAERAADHAIEKCERQAREILHAAQKQAQRIAQRTDVRITLMHMRCSQRMAEQRRSLARAAISEVSEEAAAPVDSAALEKAVEKLAASLSGADEVDL
jgi:vacuolar-type H+-ATPase subunit H